jgi:putative transport protein
MIGGVQEFVNRLVPGSVGQAILVLSAVTALGVGLGSLRFRKLGLGSAGVLFTGIFLGQLGFHIDPAILEFVRDFGLLLFVYSVGLQVGPSFFSSLRGRALGLNLLAGFIVTLGTLTALALRYLFNLSAPAAAGLLAGATTNTPSLAAAQTVLEAMPFGQNNHLGMGYAVAYPFGIAGIITVILLTRAVFRARPSVMTGTTLNADAPWVSSPIMTKRLYVTKTTVVGRTLRELALETTYGAVATRVTRSGGLKSGHGFLTTVLSARGVLWAASGILITVLPLLAGTLLGRKVFRLNDAALSGVLAGSMTDPPALAFASSQANPRSLWWLTPPCTR